MSSITIDIIGVAELIEQNLMTENVAPADRKCETIFGDRKDLLLNLVLIALVLVGYGSTLNFFFTADDLWQVHYAYRIFNGDTQLFWRNFIGNYIQIPGFEFYRPLLGLTFWSDYLLGKTNPFVYHLTSTFLYTIDVILLFGFTKRLVGTFVTSDQAAVRASAFATAALFAVNPLHCEAVTWLSGRADVLAAIFYLMTLNMVLDSLNGESRKLYLKPLSWVTFILALGSKEIAIGIPIVVFGLAVLRPASGSETAPKTHPLFPKSIANAFIVAFPFLAIAALYLAFRFAIFGSIFGGYTGSFGLVKAKYASMLWFDPQVWMRIVFPFNGMMLRPVGVYEIVLLVQLILGGLLCAGRSIAERKIHWRLAAFLLLWTITLLAPLTTVWGLDPARHNSRLLFTLSMPLSAWLPCWLLAWHETTKNKGWHKSARVVSTVLLSGMAALLLCASAISNQAWRTAGDIVNQIRLQCSELTTGLAKDKRIMVLGIPDDYNGAMVILNGSTLHHLLSPPFCTTPVIEQVISFKPFLIGPGDLIDSSRLKKLLGDGSVKSVYAWNQKSRRLELVSLTLPLSNEIASDRQVKLEAFQSTEPGYYANLKVNPLSVDYLTFTLLSNSRKNNFVPITLWWNDDEQNRSKGLIRLLPPPERTPVNIALSDNWRWYCAPEINSLKLHLGNLPLTALEDVQLVSSDLLTPSLEVTGPARTTGEHVLKPNSVEINWNASKVADASKTILEITKPNFFFGGSEMIPLEQIIAHTEVLQTRGSMRLPEKWFQNEGFYELRLHAFNKHGSPVGEFSQTATVYCSSSGSSAYLD